MAREVARAAFIRILHQQLQLVACRASKGQWPWASFLLLAWHSRPREKIEDYVQRSLADLQVRLLVHRTYNPIASFATRWLVRCGRDADDTVTDRSARMGSALALDRSTHMPRKFSRQGIEIVGAGPGQAQIMLGPWQAHVHVQF